MEIQTHEIIITFISRDKPGLVHEITSIISRVNVNIIDIDQSVVRGIFSIILVCDLSTAKIPMDEVFLHVKTSLEKLKDSVQGYLFMDYNKLNTSNRNIPEGYLKITVLGRDSPGIVENVSKIATKYNINIENISMISRKDIFAMDLVASYTVNQIIFNSFKSELKDTLDQQSLSIIIQEGDIFSEEKKLVVFDMDSTLIREECINEIGGALNLKSRIAEITNAAMDGKIDFEKALRERVELLKGIRREDLKKIADNLTLTPGAKELVDSLKRMGYKVALISGGFTYFTNLLKKRLDLDYAFGNELIFEDGVVTGEINDNLIVDAEQKAKIQRWIAQIEKIPLQNIITIGDGANDRIMIQNSGLGIGFKPKNILKSVADGIINEDNLLGVLYALGDIKKKKYKKVT
ncbi:MAG: phosphoserine phosphatase SerB [Promethearchaeota archaeon]